MSAARNPDSVTAGQGEVKPRVPRDEPQTTKGHAPGVLVGNDAVPEFSAQTLPAGTAPSESTFQPNPINETPGQADNELANRQHGKEATFTAANDFPGATSKDVHTGYGHPGQGQVASDVPHKGGKGLKEATGRGEFVAQDRLDPEERERNFDDSRAKNFDPMSAGEKLPEGAETVATERD